MSGDPHNEERRDQAPETSAWAGLGAAWRGVPVEASPPIDVAAIRRRSNRFAWTVRLRNGAEWLACAVLVLVGGRGLIHPLARVPWPLSVALIVVATSVAIYLARHARNLRAPAPTATTAEHLEHERAQLRRQHRLLSSVRRWYLAPIFAWIALTYAWVFFTRAQSSEGLHGSKLVEFCLSFAGQVAFFALLDFINRRAARKLAAKLASLEGPVDDRR